MSTVPNPTVPTANTRWSALGTGTNLVTYSPGDEVTNLGLLFTRIYPTFDGTDDSSPVKVTATAEKNSLGGLASPTARTLTTLYGEKDFYEIPTTEKQVPGFDNSPIWTLMTDNDEEFVGRSYAGKPESLSTIEFTIPAVFELMKAFSLHASKNSVFTIIQCYDDGMLDDLYYIVVPRCTIAGLSSSPQKNNSGALFKLRFKPMGGKFIPKYIKQSRTSS